MRAEIKSHKSSFLIDSFSTRATSLNSRSISTELLRTASIKEHEPRILRHGSNLQVIPELITESEHTSSGGQDDIKCRLTVKHSSSASSKNGSNEDKKTVLRSSTDSEEERKGPLHDGRSKLDGRFVIGIRDSNHMNHLNLRHQRLTMALVKNFIPVVYQSDIELSKTKTLLSIIPDYFDTSNEQSTRITQSPSMDVLSFTSILHHQRHALAQKQKKGMSQSFSVQDLTKLESTSPNSPYQGPRKNVAPKLGRARVESKSTERVDPKSKAPDIIMHLNLDPMPVTPDLRKSVDATKVEYLSLIKTKSIDIVNHEAVILHDCCRENFSQCSHRTKIAYITLSQLIDTAFSSSKHYYYLVLLCTYQKLFDSHTTFAQEVIRYYYCSRGNQKRQKVIVFYLIRWLDFRNNELLADDGNVVSVLQQFVELSLLLNFRLSKKLERLLHELKQQIEQLNCRKKMQHSQLLAQQQTPRNRRRHQSMTFNHANAISKHFSSKHEKKSEVYQPSIVNLSTRECIDPFRDLIVHNNIDWAIYIEVPCQVLQRQLWIVDVKLMSSMRIAEFEGLYHSPNYLRQLLPINEIVRSVLQSVSQHFNLLSYHMIFCIIMCPSYLLATLFNKLINLAKLSMQAQHYQLSFLLYTVLTHDITRAYLDSQVHVSLINQQHLKELVRFVQNKSQITRNQKLVLENLPGQVPCIVWMQSELYRLECQGSFTVKRGELQYINFSRLELAAHLIFPLLQLQKQTNLEELNKHVEQPYYEFFSEQYKVQLKLHLKYDVESKIEIELYKLRRRVMQQ